MVIPELKQIEHKIMAGRYRERLTHAIAAACDQLTADERFLLLMRYEAGLSLREIAKALGTHCAGVGRRLRQVQRKLRDSLIYGLSTETDMNGSAIAECLRDMVENPYHEVSLLDCIKQSMVPRKPPAPVLQWTKKPGLTLVRFATFKSNCSTMGDCAARSE